MRPVQKVIQAYSLALDLKNHQSSGDEKNSSTRLNAEARDHAKETKKQFDLILQQAIEKNHFN